MYYIAVKQRMNNGFAERNILTVANKEFFADLWDIHTMANPPAIVMDKDTFDDLIKDGYATKKEAKNDKKMLRALEDYIDGPFIQTKYMITTEEELKECYEKIMNSPQKE